MTISDSIPVQFWLNGVETFNEKTYNAITKPCYYHPFNFDDEIRLQFTDTQERDYRLTIIDINENELDQLVFSIDTSGDDYVYSLDFTFQSLAITERFCRFRIGYFVSDEPTWDTMVTFDTTTITFDEE